MRKVPVVARRLRGFTLIELLVVLAVAAAVYAGSVSAKNKLAKAKEHQLYSAIELLKERSLNFYLANCNTSNPVGSAQTLLSSGFLVPQDLRHPFGSDMTLSFSFGRPAFVDITVPFSESRNAQILSQKFGAASFNQNSARWRYHLTAKAKREFSHANDFAKSMAGSVCE